MPCSSSLAAKLNYQCGYRLGSIWHDVVCFQNPGNALSRSIRLLIDATPSQVAFNPSSRTSKVSEPWGRGGISDDPSGKYYRPSFPKHEFCCLCFISPLIDPVEYDRLLPSRPFPSTIRGFLSRYSATSVKDSIAIRTVALFPVPPSELVSVKKRALPGPGTSHPLSDAHKPDRHDSF